MPAVPAFMVQRGKPYLECVLKGIPPVVSAEEVELGDHGDERQRRWREQKQAELDRSVWQTQEAVDRARTAQQQLATVASYTCVCMS